MCKFGQYCDMSNKPLVIHVLKILINGLGYQNISDLITSEIKQNHTLIISSPNSSLFFDIASNLAEYLACR